MQLEKLKEYWVDIKTLQKINWIQKYALIILWNILINRLEEDFIKRIRDKNLLPLQFNIENEIKKIKEDEQYLWLIFLLLYVKKIYEIHLDTRIKSIKVSKSDIKKNKEQIINISIDEIIDWLNRTIEHYYKINS